MFLFYDSNLFISRNLISWKWYMFIMFFFGIEWNFVCLMSFWDIQWSLNDQQWGEKCIGNIISDMPKCTEAWRAKLAICSTLTFNPLLFSVRWNGCSTSTHYGVGLVGLPLGLTLARIFMCIVVHVYLHSWICWHGFSLQLPFTLFQLHPCMNRGSTKVSLHGSSQWNNSCE